MDAAALRREHDEGITATNRKLYDTRAMVDVTVTVGDMAFPCHKALLAAWSGYFRSMFSSDFTEKQASHVTLPEWHMVSPKAFSVLHRWIYLGELSLSLDSVEIILPSAFYLQMDKTVDMLTDYIRYEYSRGVPVSRMFDHLSLAHSCGVPAVRDIALEGMASKFDEVVEMEDFLPLKADDLLRLIRMDQLHAQSEDIVFSAAFAWLRHSDDRLIYLHDIVKSLRVGLVSARTIRKALDIKILSINSGCCDILLDVLATRESDKTSLEKDHSAMFIGRTNSPLAKTRVRSLPQPDLQELYSDVWRDAYVSLGDTCPDFADVTVMVDGEAFRSHKAVLFGWSRYFERRFLQGEGSARLDVSPPTSRRRSSIAVSAIRSLLQRTFCAQAHDQHQDSSGMKHVSLTGGHMTKTAFSAVLNWIYRGECKVTAENLCDVIMCARCLQMDVMVSLLEAYFHKNLSASVGGEIMTVLRSAKDYDIKDVYETCVNQIVGHFEKLSGSEEFIRLLDFDTLLRLLQDDRLKVRDENTVFKVALSWLRYSESNLAHTGDVIKSCRLGLVETDILNDDLEVVFLSRDLDTFNLLRQMTKKAPGSLDALRKDRPELFRRRTTRKKKGVPQFKSRWSDADTQEYRDGYPGKIDNPDLHANADFYMNKIQCKPDGDYIDNIHIQWFGDYQRLERHHGYIQWLFPVRENGTNYQAQELQEHEALAIRDDPESEERVLKSYELMLDFYGMKLKSRDTGQVERSKNWKERFQHLNKSCHNDLRITRILKSLGELGFENLKKPFLEFILEESLKKGTLINCHESCRDYWVQTLRDDADRQALMWREARMIKGHF